MIILLSYDVKKYSPLLPPAEPDAYRMDLIFLWMSSVYFISILSNSSSRILEKTSGAYILNVALHG